VNPAAEARARVASLQSELAAVNAALADKSLGPDLRAELEREAARLRQEMETVRIASSSQEQPLAATATPGLNAGQTQRSKAPDLVVRMSGGAEFDLSKQIKRPVVIQFFATWSGPCKKALPELAKLSRDLDGRADVVLIRGSMSEDEAQDAQAAGGQERALTAATDLLRSVGAGALGERVAVDADGSIAARWNIKAVPAIFLIAPDGSVAQSWLGIGKDTYGEIRGAVDTLNPKPAAAPAAPAAQGS
jgi:thiol-disulfide isomerase/thioredoxin